MDKIKRIERYIREAGIGNHRYELKMSESIIMVEMALESPTKAVWLAFDYGRAKGYREAKKELDRG